MTIKDLKCIYVFAVFFLCSCLNATDEAQDEPFPLEALPNELIVLVYDFLEPQERIALSSVNTQLRSLRPVRKITVKHIEALRLIFEGAPNEVASYLDFNALVELDIDFMGNDLYHEIDFLKPRKTHIKVLSLLKMHFGSDSLRVDNALVALAPGLLELQRVHFLRTYISDEGLIALAKSPQLQALNLWNFNKITDVGLRTLAEWTQLQRLDLSQISVSAIGLSPLSRLTQLQHLVLCRTRIDNASLVYLAKLTQLQSLDLFVTEISDAGLVHLAGLSALKDLNLSRTYVGDAGLVHLAGLTALRSLGLSETRVGDAGLPYLVGLSALQALNLYFTQVTNAGVAALQERLPGLKITHITP